MNAAVAQAKAAVAEARIAHGAVVQKYGQIDQCLKAMLAGEPLPEVGPEIQAAYENLMVAEAAHYAAIRAAEAVEAAKGIKVGYPKNGGPWKYGA